jgi:hypothetical protein
MAADDGLTRRSSVCPSLHSGEIGPINLANSGITVEGSATWPTDVPVIQAEPVTPLNPEALEAAKKTKTTTSHSSQSWEFDVPVRLPVRPPTRLRAARRGPVRRPERTSAARPRERRSVRRTARTTSGSRDGPLPSSDDDPEPPGLDPLGVVLTLRLRAHLLRRAGVRREA